MSLTTSAERRALSTAEWEAVEPSHYPAICGLERQQLNGLRVRVRGMRDKARDRANQQRREMRGKAAPRGAEPVSDATGAKLKLSVLSAALKRLNKEAARFEQKSGRRSQAALSRAALELRNESASDPRHPAPGRTSDEGMNSVPHPEVAPSGALNEEGQRPVLERSRKVR
jgi:sulfite reductase alpha subunit-like flavoprotein